MIPSKYLKEVRNGKYRDVAMTDLANLFCFPVKLICICQECEYAFMGVTPFGAERFQCPNCKGENFINLESYIEVLSNMKEKRIEEGLDNKIGDSKKREDKWYNFFMKKEED